MIRVCVCGLWFVISNLGKDLSACSTRLLVVVLYVATVTQTNVADIS